MSRFYIFFIISAIFFILICCDEQHEKTRRPLETGFINPPVDARPRGYWCWVNGNVDTSRLTEELREARDKGMGGYDIWDINPVVDENKVVPDGPPFMGEESLNAIVYAIKEAGRFGLNIGITYSSGWNAGGPWTTPEHSTMGLFRSFKTVAGPGIFDDVLEFPELPDEYNSNNRWIKRDDNGLPVYYRDIAILAFPIYKDKLIEDTSRILNLSPLMQDNGKLKWDIPPGKWIIARYVCANTGQMLISHSANSAGPMIDHFSAEATEAHIMYFIEKLEKKLGRLDKTALKYLYGDSYEVRGDLWTPLMQDEFKHRKMYDLTKFLPVFDGYILISPDVTERFRYDYQQTLSDLIIDNHYAKAKEICRDHGLEFVAEAAGPGMPVHNCPFESLRASGVLSWPRGEFWYKHTQSPDYPEDILQVIKGVACASHIYNQKYVEAESFTTTWLWQDGPGDLKPAADRAFCEGLNRIIFHTSPHEPTLAGRPGWIYSFGTIINSTLIWWPKSKPFMDYLARCSYMLQQGNFVGDLLYFYGDSAPNFVPPKSTDPNFIPGYDYDYINAEQLINRLNVRNGKLFLPHGQEYELLVLPESRFINFEVIKKLEELVRKGAIVIGPKPEGANGLYNSEEISGRVKEIADRIWGNCDGKIILENSFGKGKIIWGKNVSETLKERGILPDFQAYTWILADPTIRIEYLDFIHRKTDDADIYFIRNTTSNPIYFEGVFRISGKVPEIWDPLTGKTAECYLYACKDGQTRMPLYLEQDGSVFIVFDRKSDIHATDLKINDKIVFPQNYPDATTGIKYKTGKVPDLFPFLINSNWFANGTASYSAELSDGNKIEIKTVAPPEPVIPDGPWLVTFGDDRYATDSAIFNNLISWSNSSDPGIKFFSGIASYHNSFELNSPALNGQQVIMLDLGKVQEVAEVFINGMDAGILWCTPYMTDITGYVKPGKNIMVIEVANVWTNRLCGDAKLAPENRISNTNITRLPNAWSYPMATIPNNEYGLRESGLLGPVKVRFYNRLSF
jgi:hypothetical protein